MAKKPSSTDEFQLRKRRPEMMLKNKNKIAVIYGAGGAIEGRSFESTHENNISANG
jgi:hypothetical protein